MRRFRADPDVAKGWFFAGSDSDLGVAIGYANGAIDEPHLHLETMEIYLVASGGAELRVDDETVTITAGDVVVVEPGEAHTFLTASQGYRHFVVHVPALAESAARADKVAVEPGRLGL